MDDRTSGAMLLAVGGIALRLGLTDTALAYVKPGLQPPLIVAGLILIGFGTVQLAQAFRRVSPVEPEADLAIWDEHHSDADAHHEGGDDHSGHGHSHAGGPRVAWLLTLPLLALLLIAPPPLGAFAASRQADAISKPLDAQFGPLPEPVDGAVEVTLSEYSYRALYDTQQSLEGKTVRLTGFITAAEQGDEASFRLTRFIVSCCAADGQAINVAVKSDESPPPVETWVELEGRWAPRPDHEVGKLTLKPPILKMSSMRQVAQPAQPYEY